MTYREGLGHNLMALATNAATTMTNGEANAETVRGECEEGGMSD